MDSYRLVVLLTNIKLLRFVLLFIAVRVEFGVIVTLINTGRCTEKRLVEGSVRVTECFVIGVCVS